MAKRINAAYIKTILLTLEVTLLFFVLPDVFFANPFVKTWMLPSGDIATAIFPPANATGLLVPSDGQGMNPSLRHVAMLLHPPTLYVGLIGFFIPYAFLLAALLRGDDPAIWVRPLYPLALISWTSLTIGMFLGSWWAYTILGWGGYWGWDAVEISGLVPWLLSFGLIHSMRMQLHEYSYRRWISGFSIAIVILTLFGILITRSGILESVHAYTSGAMGPVLTVLILMHLCACLFLLAYRREDFQTAKPAALEVWDDRITNAFNLCLVVLVIICLFGQTLPLTSQLFGEPSASFSISDYERWTAPFFLLLVILTALCPLSPLFDKQGKKAGRILTVSALLSLLVPLALVFLYPISLLIFIGFWAVAFLFANWLISALRKGSSGLRLSAILLHLGIAILAFGILGVETLSGTFEGKLAAGNPISVNGYAFSSGEFNSYLSPSGNVVFELPVTIAHADSTREVRPAVIHFTKLGTLYARPGLATGWLQDVQVILEETPRSADQVYSLRIAFYPLIDWIWAGCVLMVLSGLWGFVERRLRSMRSI